ncbi:unnamed protein product, partial [Polarella glacialis]
VSHGARHTSITDLALSSSGVPNMIPSGSEVQEGNSSLIFPGIEEQGDECLSSTSLLVQASMGSEDVLETETAQPLVPCSSNALLDELMKFRNMILVPEPVDLETYNLLDFAPEREELEQLGDSSDISRSWNLLGQQQRQQRQQQHEVAPWQPTHQRHLNNRLAKTLRDFQENPGLFESLVNYRLRQFDGNVRRQ